MATVSRYLQYGHVWANVTGVTKHMKVLEVVGQNLIEGVESFRSLDVSLLSWWAQGGMTESTETAS